MEKRIGFIGCGNMAKAMIGAIVESGILEGTHIMASDHYEPSLKEMADKYRIGTSQDNMEVLQQSDILFLAVKPNMYQGVIEEIRDSIKFEQIVVTIAPGKTLEQLEQFFGKEVKILRTMPNTPALVGAGITAICPNRYLMAEEVEMLKKIIATFGLVEEIEEKLFDAVVAVSGSSPAYLFMMIEAMADGAVMQGMPRAQAYRFAAQAMIGSAKMQLETGKHPGELKDMVCSPGGTTIEAVAELEKKGFRAAVIEAMLRCGDKSSKM